MINVLFTTMLFNLQHQARTPLSAAGGPSDSARAASIYGGAAAISGDGTAISGGSAAIYGGNSFIYAALPAPRTQHPPPSFDLPTFHASFSGGTPSLSALAAPIYRGIRTLQGVLTTVPQEKK